jgi:uncharacterized protein (DUF885 family)
MTSRLSMPEQFDQILHDEWESRLQADPLFATYTGDHRYNDRLPDASEAGYASWLATLKELRRRLAAIDPKALDSGRQMNHAILARLLENEQDELVYHTYRFPISKTWGFYNSIFEQLPYIMPFVSTGDYENYLARLAAFPEYIRKHVELMQVGLDTGYLPSRVTLVGVEEQVRKYIVTPATDSMLYLPFKTIPPAIEPARQALLRQEAEKIILQEIHPALGALADFITHEYVPGGRENIAASDLPDGQAFYLHRIRHFTSLSLTPLEIHQTGMNEVGRIRREMEEVIHAVNFKGDFKAFIHFLRSDERFYASTPQGLLKETAYILKRMDGELPRLFGRLPTTPYGIREVPAPAAPSSTTAYYFPASGDGRTAGFYYVNTYDLKSRPLYEIEALSLHEAVPGHHLQIALQQELDLPNFRRFGGFTAFVEGWALYAERLGLEVGFYSDPYSNFGRLSYEMWRACRLVVDTGIHALGWTRQQAIDFMAQNTSSTLLNIINEIDRYIAWPGQALAYKIGELKIRALRARAEQVLGDHFDLRSFHDQLLARGALPLDILEAVIEAWINSPRAGA